MYGTLYQSPCVSVVIRYIFRSTSTKNVVLILILILIAQHVGVSS